MTTIKLEKNKNITLSVSGHCSADRVNGSDLCCAAVSMLSYTIMQRLKELKPSRLLISTGEANVEISFKKTGIKGILARIALMTIMSGFRLLEAKYPENVHVVSV